MSCGQSCDHVFERTQLRILVKENGDEVLQFLRDGFWVNVPREQEVVHDEAQDALENIEQEIIARACRNGVCED
jgi:hypothetical protein